MSVHQLPDGRWICKFPAGTIPGQPKKRKEYFGRGEEGEAAARSRNAEVGVVTAKKVTTPSFSSLAQQYMDSKGPNMTESTFSSLQYKMIRIIIPSLLNLHAHEIDHAAMDRFVASRKKIGVKNRTIRDDLTYIRAVMRFAMQRGLIISNPVAGYSLPRDDSTRITPPNRAEFEAIVEKAAPHIQRAMWTAYFTGARPGPIELFSLTWTAVDFFRGTITITSAQKGGIELRELNIPEKFMVLLRKWWEEDLEKEKKTGEKPCYIIHYNGGKVQSIRTGWEAAKKRAGVTRRLRRYDLRHMTATELLAAGVDIVTIAEILGNTVEQCSNAYLHVSNARKKNALDQL